MSHETEPSYEEERPTEEEEVEVQVASFVEDRIKDNETLLETDAPSETEIQEERDPIGTLLVQATESVQADVAVDAVEAGVTSIQPINKAEDWATSILQKIVVPNDSELPSASLGGGGSSKSGTLRPPRHKNSVSSQQVLLSSLDGSREFLNFEEEFIDQMPPRPSSEACPSSQNAVILGGMPVLAKDALQQVQLRKTCHIEKSGETHSSASGAALDASLEDVSVIETCQLEGHILELPKLAPVDSRDAQEAEHCLPEDSFPKITLKPVLAERGTGMGPIETGESELQKRRALKAVPIADRATQWQPKNEPMAAFDMPTLKKVSASAPEKLLQREEPSGELGSIKLKKVITPVASKPLTTEPTNPFASVQLKKTPSPAAPLKEHDLPATSPWWHDVKLKKTGTADPH
jgi:hypothetical protein